MQIKNFKPRKYQETIAKTCEKNNTLIVLPTGMGKTKTAIIATIARLQLYPNSQILFLTPTKPLANQIQKEFLESTTIENITVFTGEVTPTDREKTSKDTTVIISTPQTITNDIINSRIDLKKFSLLILDEAHRCVKDYDYTWIANQFNKISKYPRIIGLTASPGSEINKIKEVCKNAFIDKIEVRTTEDEDVKEYVQEIQIEWIKVDFPEELKEIQKFLIDCYETKLSQIRVLNITKKNEFSKKELLNMLGAMQARMARGEKDFRIMRGVSIVAEAIKVQHAQELLETQGVQSTLIYFQKLYLESETTKVKSVKNLVKDLNFHSAYLKLNQLKDHQHPKLIKLKELIIREKELNPELKAIVFNQYRDQAKIIREELEKIQGIRPKLFVGQQKKSGTGLSQKKQIEIINSLKTKEINVLISTNIGEEGLDIPKVDLVIFFEPVPSAIRTIQRRGRTARTEKGKVIIMMTKNTRDEIYHWVSFHKEKQMYNILSKLKKDLNFKEQATLSNFSEVIPKVNILADSRETKSQILKKLKDDGYIIKTEQLDVGDYIISDKIAIERKTPEDFINSILDKRIFSQIKKLRENFSSPLLVIEGEEDIYSIRKIHPNAILGTLASITLNYHVPIIYTKNGIETANLIKVIINKEKLGKKDEYPIRIEKKPLTTQEQQEYIVESFPGVGPNIAKSLLKKFKTIKSIVNISKEELKEIENIGPKKAEDIIKLFEEKY